MSNFIVLVNPGVYNMRDTSNLVEKVPMLKGAPIIYMRRARWTEPASYLSFRVLKVDSSIDLSEMDVDELIETLKDCKKVREVEDLAEENGFEVVKHLFDADKNFVDSIWKVK